MERNDHLENFLDIPEFCICPITGEVMNDPVCVITGQSYEKEAITEWFRRGNNKNPVTGNILPMKTTIPNYNLKYAIEYIRNKLPKYQKEAETITDVNLAVSKMEEKYNDTSVEKKSNLSENDNLINELIQQVSLLENQKYHTSNRNSILNQNLSELEEQLLSIKKQYSTASKCNECKTQTSLYFGCRHCHSISCINCTSLFVFDKNSEPIFNKGKYTKLIASSSKDNSIKI